MIGALIMMKGQGMTHMTGERPRDRRDFSVSVATVVLGLEAPSVYFRGVGTEGGGERVRLPGRA